MWLKDRLARFLYVPRGLAVGQGTTFIRPWSIRNPELITIGERVTIRANAAIQIFWPHPWRAEPPHLVIEDGTYIGKFLDLHCTDSVRIGRNCAISDYVYISDGTHSFDLRDERHLNDRPFVMKGGVDIGEGTFLAFRTSVMPGVTIGKFCIIATGAIVTHSVPDYSMVAGVPGRVIKKWDPDRAEWVPVTKTILPRD